MSGAPVHAYVLRDTGMSVVFWLAAAGTAVLVGDTVLRGAWAALAATAGIAGFVLWVLWMTLFHPHVRATEDGLTITNIGRVHTMPWSRVVSIRQSLNLVFELDDGRLLRAIGVTAKRDRGLVLGSLTRGRAGVGSGRFHDARDDLERLRAAAPASDAAVVSRWDVVPLLIGAVLAVVLVVDILVLAFA